MTCPKDGSPCPLRPRTTGPHSQNRRLNGFIAQICKALSRDFDTVKCEVKLSAIQLGFPPYEEIVTSDGHRLALFKSEADCTVQECGYLITAAEQYAAEHGVILKEE